jgi:Periplasmic binding protein
MVSDRGGLHSHTLRYRKPTAVLGVVPVAAGCASSNKSSSSTTTPTNAQGLIDHRRQPQGQRVRDIHVDDQDRANCLGRQLQLVTCDDASSGNTNTTCTQDLNANGVFGIIAESAFVYGGYRYIQQQGIPLTGGAHYGPKCGQ